MATDKGRSITTHGGSRLRLQPTGEVGGFKMWNVYITAQRTPGGNEVVKLDAPRRIGRIADDPHRKSTFAQPLDKTTWAQDATITGAARFLGQLAELGMV